MTTAVAPSSTAAPSISGTAEDGHTLTASSGSWSGSSPVSYVYQWQDCNASGGSCTNISGATSSSYTLHPSVVGSTVRVSVTATNLEGSSAASSAATGVVQALPPANTQAPTISGTAEDGQTLTASNGSWSGSTPLSYSYQWSDCNSSGGSCQNISGATSQTYQARASDVGDTLKVAVTASNASLPGGGSASASSAATGVVQALPPANTQVPSVSGTAQDGQTLTASNGSWSGSTPLSYSYQWSDCNSSGGGCQNISGATAQTYTLQSSDVGSTVVVAVTASNSSLPGGGSASASSSPTGVVGAGGPTNTSPPIVSGSAQQGQTLSASSGSWTGSGISYGYQWQSCDPNGDHCANIAGATQATYLLGQGDVGTTVQVVVTATDSDGQGSAASQPTGVVQPPSGSALITYSYDANGRLSSVTGP